MSNGSLYACSERPRFFAIGQSVFLDRCEIYPRYISRALSHFKGIFAPTPLSPFRSYIYVIDSYHCITYLCEVWCLFLEAKNTKDVVSKSILQHSHFKAKSCVNRLVNSVIDNHSEVNLYAFVKVDTSNEGG